MTLEFYQSSTYIWSTPLNNNDTKSMMPHVICFGHIGSPFLCASICEINENTASGLGLDRRTSGLVWWVTGSDIDARSALLAPVFTRRPHASLPQFHNAYMCICIQFHLCVYLYNYTSCICPQFHVRLYVYTYTISHTHICIRTV